MSISRVWGAYAVQDNGSTMTQALDPAAPSQARPWLKDYPPGVPGAVAVDTCRSGKGFWLITSVSLWTRVLLV